MVRGLWIVSQQPGSMRTTMRHSRCTCTALYLSMGQLHSQAAGEGCRALQARQYRLGPSKDCPPCQQLQLVGLQVLQNAWQLLLDCGLICITCCQQPGRHDHG